MRKNANKIASGAGMALTIGTADKTYKTKDEYEKGMVWDMKDIKFDQMVQESVAYIKAKAGVVPQIVIVLGSGLGTLGGMVENPTFIPYGEIPHFQTSPAPGHAGRIILGTLSGNQVVCMQGRFHHV